MSPSRVNAGLPAAASDSSETAPVVAGCSAATATLATASAALVAASAALVAAPASARDDADAASAPGRRCHDVLTYLLDGERATPLAQVSEILSWSPEAGTAGAGTAGAAAGVPAGAGAAVGAGAGAGAQTDGAVDAVDAVDAVGAVGAVGAEAGAVADPGSALRGLLIDRGRAIAVMCLARLTGRPPAADAAAASVLVVACESRWVGFAVPSLEGIESASWTVAPAAAADGLARAVARAGRPPLALLGSGSAERMVPMLDLRALARELHRGASVD